MLKEAILLGVMAGLIFSWKKKTFLSSPPFKYLVVALMGAAGFLVSLRWAPVNETVRDYFPAIHGISLFIIALGIFMGNHPGYKVAGVGVLMNAVAVFSNGAMPVEEECLSAIGDVSALYLIASGKTLTHTLADTETRLRFLGDRFVFSSPMTSPRVMSAGDVLIAIGLFIVMASAVSYIFRRTDHSELD